MARVAFVTGGTRGIGKAISARLRTAGYQVAAGYAGNEVAAKAAACSGDDGDPPIEALFVQCHAAFKSSDGSRTDFRIHASIE